MDYVYGTQVVCLFALPPLLAFSVTEIRRMWRTTQTFPTYWVFVHAAAYCVFLVPAFAPSYRISTVFFFDLLVLGVFWGLALAKGIQWIRRRERARR